MGLRCLTLTQVVQGFIKISSNWLRLVFYNVKPLIDGFTNESWSVAPHPPYVACKYEWLHIKNFRPSTAYRMHLTLRDMWH